MTYRHIFGPVPSRRLGFSLGIDLVPLKTCNLNCIYCECGRTTRQTADRREYVSLVEVRAELIHYLAGNPAPDYLTFSGSGEPLLHSGAGELLTWIKDSYPGIPLAILTNGALFSNPEVRALVQRADLVLPSLDAATQEVFKKIDRPLPALQIETIIEGLVSLRREYPGKIWLEVFIVPGLNDSETELAALKRAILRIAPDRVQLNTLDRPGAVADIRAATRSELERIADIWQLPGIDMVARNPAGAKLDSARSERESALLETIARRPCTLEDLSVILGWHINEVNKFLGVLEEQGKIQSRRQGEMVFYEQKYPSENHD